MLVGRKRVLWSFGFVSVFSPEAWVWAMALQSTPAYKAGTRKGLAEPLLSGGCRYHLCSAGHWFPPLTGISKPNCSIQCPLPFLSPWHQGQTVEPVCSLCTPWLEAFSSFSRAQHIIIKMGSASKNYIGCNLERLTSLKGFMTRHYIFQFSYN